MVTGPRKSARRPLHAWWGMRRSSVLLVVFATGALLLGWRDFGFRSGSATLAPATDIAGTGAGTGRTEYITPNTVRLSGLSPYAQATAITQSTYAATQHEDRPHAITLVRADRPADAMLAAARVTHFPVNSPVLYVDADRIPPETLAELRRLGPDGNTYDNGVQVYLVGAISPAVEREVQTRLGYRTRAFRVDDPIRLSEMLDTWAAAVHADHPDAVAVVQLRALATGFPAVTWNAHMGDGFVFVDGATIPPATRRILRRRFAGKAFIYLIGDTSVIPDSVARSLARYGHVQRVEGRTPSEIAVAFARFRDAGLNQGRWIGFSLRDFGWGLAEAGHNFVIVNPANWHAAVTGSLLSHMGKHGPLLFAGTAGVDSATAQYIASMRPSAAAPRDQLTNHAWILGPVSSISWAAQADLDLMLQPAR